MWTLIISVYSTYGVSIHSVPGFVSEKAAEAAKAIHSKSLTNSMHVCYAIVHMGDA